MFCEQCHQHEATVHIQEIIGQKKTSLHLCSGCAAAKGLKDGPMSELDVAKLVLHLTSAAGAKATDLINPVEAMSALKTPAAADAKPDLACPACGLTSSEFKAHGRLGCSECYAVFGAVLRNLLRELHRDLQHRGKTPGRHAPPPHLITAAVEQDLVALETALARAIDAEAYERAAGIRDQIRSLRETQHPQDHLEKKPADNAL